MSKINLLPWREARRKELQTQFVMFLGLVALIAVAGVGVMYKKRSSKLQESQKA